MNYKILVIIKPETYVNESKTGEIIGILENNGVVFRYNTSGSISWELYEKIYKCNITKPFYNWAFKYLSLSNVLFLIGDSIYDPFFISNNICGSCPVENSKNGTIRERYGLFSGISTLHVSDSITAGIEETKYCYSKMQFEIYNKKVWMDARMSFRREYEIAMIKKVRSICYEFQHVDLESKFDKSVLLNDVLHNELNYDIEMSTKISKLIIQSINGFNCLEEI